MTRSAVSPYPADRRAALEAIARALRGGAPADPARDLAAWTAGVEVVECLERAGFTVVRCAGAAPGVPPTSASAAAGPAP